MSAKKQRNLTSKQQTLTSPTNEPEILSEKRLRQRRLLLAVISIGVFLTIYLLRLDRVCGMFMDDAWYALLAKAIATGQGYTLINSPTPGILPLYPPFFPFLLSLAFKLSPQFPQNVWLLKAVSMLAMLLTGVATYWYLKSCRGWPEFTAALVGLVVAVSPGLVFMATSSLMSECVFALLQMLSLLAVEHCVRQREGARLWLYSALAGLSCSLAFLTRSMAIGLVLAACIYFLKERLFRSLLVFAVCTGVIVGAWTFYTRSHKPTAAQRAEVNNYIVRPYSEQFWDRLAGHEGQASIALSDLPERCWNNLSAVLSNDAGGILLPSFFPALNQGLAERGSGLQLLLSLIACALIVTGFYLTVREKITCAELALPLSLAIIIAWPFPPYRFLLPSLPLLAFYFLVGTKILWRLNQRLSGSKLETLPWPVLTGFATALLALCLVGNFDYIQRKYADNPQQRPRLLRIFNEQEALLKWTTDNLPTNEIIVTPNPALAYLYTGRKTTTFANPEANWVKWNQLGVRYLVQLSPTRLPEPSGAEQQYRVMHRAGGELNLRVVDLGLPSSRPNWGAEKAPATINLDGSLR